VTQHAGLPADRRGAFSRDEHILMIANEMHRGSALLRRRDAGRVRTCYERVLQLVDLTVRVRAERSFLRELLRWRELVAALYLEDLPRLEAHRELLRCVLFFTPAAARQVPELVGVRRASAARSTRRGAAS
jgi:hypothetical protein